MRSVAPVLRGLLAAWLVCIVMFPATAAARGPAGSILRAVNSARARHHLPRLHASRGLARAAASWSAEMARSGSMSHGAFQARIAATSARASWARTWRTPMGAAAAAWS